MYLLELALIVFFLLLISFSLPLRYSIPRMAACSLALFPFLFFSFIFLSDSGMVCGCMEDRRLLLRFRKENKGA